jgi:hypothetical protein
VLGEQLFENARRQVDAWLDGPAQQLDHTWLRVSGVSNTRVRLTATEVGEINQKIDELLGTYVLRPDRDVPAEARDVRILRYFLPEAGA